MDNMNGDIIIYQTEDGLTKIDVKVENETVWLSQQQMAELFKTSRTNVIEHINNIYSEEELDKNSTCQNFRQVLDLYATAVDYNPKDEKSVEFFKIVQNKLHYAAHGHTASEVIYERADSDKPFMGLTTFKGDIPVLSDVVIAKNYLSEEELKVLNNLVSGYFDFAEIQAIRHNPMHMEDYIKQLDLILSSTGEKLLAGAGTISHEKAIDKVKTEYRKYQVKTISPVEQEYLNTLKEISSKIEIEDKK